MRSLRRPTIPIQVTQSKDLIKLKCQMAKTVLTLIQFFANKLGEKLLKQGIKKLVRWANSFYNSEPQRALIKRKSKRQSLTRALCKFGKIDFRVDGVNFYSFPDNCLNRVIRRTASRGYGLSRQV